jgi:tetratricopeptide (TPR) repeat protein
MTISTITSQTKITGPLNWLSLTFKETCDANTISKDPIKELNPRLSEKQISNLTNPVKIGKNKWSYLDLPNSPNNLNELLNSTGLGKGSNPNTVVYAHGIIDSPKDQNNVALRIGSDDSIKVYLNGEVVHENPVLRGANDYLEEVKINLKSGQNTILVKVVNCGGGFSLYFGIQADFSLSGLTYKPIQSTTKYVDQNALKDFQMARSLNSQGKIDEAITYFERAETSAPDNPLYSFGYGYDMFYKNRLSLSESKLKSAISKGYENPVVHFQLAAVYRKLGEFDKSLSQLDVCIDKGKEIKKRGEKEKNGTLINDGLSHEWNCEIEKTFVYNDLFEFKKSESILEKLKNQISFSDDLNYTKQMLKSGIGYVMIVPILKNSWARAIIETNLWRGHISHHENKPRDALKYYTTANSMIDSDSELQKSFKYLEAHKYLEITKNVLKYEKTKPDYIHKIYSVYINNLKGNFKLYDGKEIVLNNTISERQKKITPIMESLLSKFILGFSEGRLKIDFIKNIEVNEPITNYTYGDGGRTNSADLNSLSPYNFELADILNREAHLYDTVFYYFNGDGIAKNAWGGGILNIFVPYYSNSLIRGFGIYPTNWFGIQTMDLFIHEFFHNRDVMIPKEGVLSAGHMEDGKKKYPEFKGTTQYEYYKWHMEKTPQKIFGTLGYIDRYKDIRNPEILKSVQKYIFKYSYDTLKELRDLTKTVNELKSKNPKSPEIEKQWNKILSIMPEHQEALLALYQIYLDKKDFQKALEYQLKRFEVFPDFDTYSRLGHVYRELKNIDLASNYYLEGIKVSEEYGFRGFHYFDLLKSYGNLLRDQTNAPENAMVYYDKCIQISESQSYKGFLPYCIMDKAILVGRFLKNKEEGYALVKKSIELGNDNSYTRWWLNQFNPNQIASRSLESKMPALPKEIEQENISSLVKE